ncbi:MAG: hypothetical protein ABI700_04265 [Chloroflexota bacterium]
MRLTRTNIARLFAVVILAYVGLASHFLTKSLAQDTPTQRPFPARATATPDTATVETTADVVQGQPTERSFPVRATANSPTATVETTAEATVVLTTGDALATASAAQVTAAQLVTENKSLQDQLAAAQTDKGATLYAIVIVVIGALLAFGVFFGLRRGGK